jgi:hypothetical protein
MGFYGRAASHKPKSTIRYAKRWLEWYKAQCHWTLEQWKHVLWSDESRVIIWQRSWLNGSKSLQKCSNI